MTRLSILIFLSVPVFIFTEPVSTFAIVIVILAVYGMARLPSTLLRTFLTSWSAAYVLIWVSYIYSYRKAGQVLLQFGWISVTNVAVLLSITFCLRLLGMIVVALILYGTTNERQIVAAFHKLKVPYVASFAFALGVRLLYIAGDDFYRVKEAQMTRGVEFERGNVANKLMKYVQVMVPLVVVSLYRVSTIGAAMESRAFSTGMRDRTYFYQTKFGKIDYVVNLALIAANIAVVVMTYVYGYFTMPWLLKLLGSPL